MIAPPDSMRTQLAEGRQLSDGSGLTQSVCRVVVQLARAALLRVGHAMALPCLCHADVRTASAHVDRSKGWVFGRYIETHAMALAYWRPWRPLQLAWIVVAACRACTKAPRCRRIRSAAWMTVAAALRRRCLASLRAAMPLAPAWSHRTTPNATAVPCTLARKQTAANDGTMLELMAPYQGRTASLASALAMHLG